MSNSTDTDRIRHLANSYPNLSQRYEVEKYITEGVPLGDFLRAVFSNDLFGAYGQADASNGLIMRDIVQWIYSHAPMQCRGTKADIDAWIAHRGLAFEYSEIEDTLDLSIATPPQQTEDPNDASGPYFGQTPGD